MILRLIISLSIIVAVSGCSSKITSRLEVRDGIEMLYGRISPEQLYFDFPEWQEIEKAYTPDPALISKLTAVVQPVDVTVFLGTWCADSELQVPLFFSVLQKLEDKWDYKLELWAVDRYKKLDNDLPEKYDIERVPTFIFERDGMEIGRIVESPVLSLEEDLLNIMLNKISPEQD